MTELSDITLEPGVCVELTETPDGLEPLAIADLAQINRRNNPDLPLLVVLRDGRRLQTISDGLAFFAPDLTANIVPAWDCMPYDRVSPNSDVTARRLAALHGLLVGQKPDLVLTTIGAATQKLLSPETLLSRSLSIKCGGVIEMNTIVTWLTENGFQREPTVREAGQFAVRGGILDLYPPGFANPVRLDFFGDTLETIRPFDPESQRSSGQFQALTLIPTSEVTLNTDSIRAFRQAYVRELGVSSATDPLYEAVSQGRRFPGLEHWLPLFADRLGTLFDYVPHSAVVLDALNREARQERSKQINDYHNARIAALEAGGSGAPIYKPLQPERLYLDEDAWTRSLAGRAQVRISPFASVSMDKAVLTISLDGRQGRTFAAERESRQTNVFDALAAHVAGLMESGKAVTLACWTEGTRDRMDTVLGDHGMIRRVKARTWSDAEASSAGTLSLAVLPIEFGFETPDHAVISEQDILGDRMVRASSRKRGKDVLTEATSLAANDLVVHADHGIGRFIGLKTVEAMGAPHDCLELEYAGGDKLYLPVENIELLTRFGSEDAGVALDRLGGGNWQARKARMKKRIRDMADALIKVAAARALKDAPVITAPDGIYDEFCARFPFAETDDQMQTIEATLEDMTTGRPMDRLVCGDVGFGKTEVALRAAFVAAMSGRQVAVIVPTTLLARQHYATFVERFRGLPIRIEQASRLVSAKEMARTKEGISNGQTDIVIGTHALLAKAIKFKNIGLLVIDEEQRFGVKHKELLKQLKDNVHVLTLTATPIPRTLQLALTGVRELSIIATPPVDRLSVRTFVSPFDPVFVREALLREHYRGGQTFYVCPRISDIADARQFLEERVPEVKVITAHGQMAPGELEDAMNAFYEGRYDVLLSTTIVESGLDIPTANTLIVHRADMFGLAQLYQIRGRVGRSKQRAYALFTVPSTFKMTPQAEKRLKVLQSLDTLGAGFTLASHDLDQRGAGNLLGEEQSGHIREVGYELYQQMLEEAVAQLRSGETHAEDDQWSPQITLGLAVLIPDWFVEDLQLRLDLYKRLSNLDSDEELETFAAEMIDRFGALPDEVEQLVEVMRIKLLCRRAGIEKVDAGPKGATLSFRNDRFENPHGLVAYISKQGSLAKVRSDHRLVFLRDWPDDQARLRGTRSILRDLVGLVDHSKVEA